MWEEISRNKPKLCIISFFFRKSKYIFPIYLLFPFLSLINGCRKFSQPHVSDQAFSLPFYFWKLLSSHPRDKKKHWCPITGGNFSRTTLAANCWTLSNCNTIFFEYIYIYILSILHTGCWIVFNTRQHYIIIIPTRQSKGRQNWSKIYMAFTVHFE